MTASPLMLSLLAAAVIAAALLALRHRHARRQRERAVLELLDAADALEARLRAARDEIEAIVGDHAEDPVRDPMREMLRQRLWLRDHGSTASMEQMAEIRASIDAARYKIDQQLLRIERARAPLA